MPRKPMMPATASRRNKHVVSGSFHSVLDADQRDGLLDSWLLQGVSLRQLQRRHGNVAELAIEHSLRASVWARIERAA